MRNQLSFISPRSTLMAFCGLLLAPYNTIWLHIRIFCQYSTLCFDFWQQLETLSMFLTFCLQCHSIFATIYESPVSLSSRQQASQERNHPLCSDSKVYLLLFGVSFQFPVIYTRTNKNRCVCVNVCMCAASLCVFLHKKTQIKAARFSSHRVNWEHRFMCLYRAFRKINRSGTIRRRRRLT